jgi:hypothetical protein
MISIKPGVDLTALQPQMAVAVPIVADIYATLNQQCRITCGNDGMLRDMKAALSGQYDVVCESDHIHVEFDPR